MTSTHTPFESVDLTSDPAMIQSLDFLDLLGVRPEIVNWDDTIQRLSNAHSRFYKLGPLTLTGNLQNINSYFIEAANWLQGKAPTANWIAIPQSANIQSITQDALNQFHDSWLPSFESTLNNDTTFTQFEQMSSQLKIFTDNLGSIKVDSEIKALVDNFQKQINHLEDNFRNFVESEKNNTVSQIERAQSLKEWATHYTKVSNDYTILIEGSNRIGLQWPRARHQGEPKYAKWRKPYFNEKRFSHENCNIHYRKIGEARKRYLWFMLLATVIILPAFLALFGNAEILGRIHNPFYIPPVSGSATETTNLILEKLRYLPIVIVVIFGYAFSNKNYRILSNLREQYKHRETVSVTLQGIIAGIDENDGNKDIRVKLVEIGAKAMFELKTIGHLTKRDSDSSPMAEIVQTIVPNK